MPLAYSPDSGLVWEYVPIPENKYLSEARPGAVSQAALEPAAIGGLALGVRPWRRGRDTVAGAALGALAGPGLDRLTAVKRQPGGAGQRDDLEARRQSQRPASRRRDQNHRRRHVRGAGASVARARHDDAGSPARHRRAGTESVLSAGAANGRSRGQRLARTAGGRRGHDLQYRARQI